MSELTTVQAHQIVYYDFQCPDCGDTHELDDVPRDEEIECTCGCYFIANYE